MGDICGADTLSGGACQNPPTDDDNPERCYIPAHNGVDEPSPVGSNSTFTEEDARIALEAAREGKSESGVEREVGVGEGTIFGDGGWIDQGLTYTDENGNECDFFRDLMRARGDGEDEWIEEGRGDGGDSSFAKFMLATSYDYKKTEKHEVTGEDGGAVDVNLNRTVVGSDE